MTRRPERDDGAGRESASVLESRPAVGEPRDGDAPPLRLTWVQPEDLVGHELRQADEDGRDTADVRRRWHAAGGAPAPDRAGASKAPAGPELRALAGALLDELAALPSPLAEDEPTGLAPLRAGCPDWPAPGGPAGTTSARATSARTTSARTTSARTTPRAAAPHRAQLPDRLEAGWLGRAAGCVLGKPVEKLPLAGIREIARATGNWPLNDWFTGVGLPAEVAERWPWNRRSRVNSLAENIDGAPEDDDLNYPLLGLLLLERHGPAFRTTDVAQLWLDEVPAGRTFTAERVAYRNLLAGVEPPETARLHNPFREWIGAQIRADIFGWIHPGDPAAAAEAAWRDATLTHTGNGVYGAMFAAALVAEAAGGQTDVHGCLRAGLSVVPARSRYAAAVHTGIELARAEPAGDAAGFAAVVDTLHERYGAHHWVHVLPNAALLAAALTHSDGDFTGAICRTVSGGWDTDSNGATAGSVTGLLAGRPDALPQRWITPLAGRLTSTVGDFDGIGFDQLAARTAALAPTAAPALAGAARTGAARTGAAEPAGRNAGKPATRGAGGTDRDRPTRP